MQIGFGIVSICLYHLLLATPRVSVSLLLRCFQPATTALSLSLSLLLYQGGSSSEVPSLPFMGLLPLIYIYSMSDELIGPPPRALLHFSPQIPTHCPNIIYVCTHSRYIYTYQIFYHIYYYYLLRGGGGGKWSCLPTLPPTHHQTKRTRLPFSKHHGRLS